MTDAETLAFLEAGHTLQVATIGKNGFPHVAPMWFVVDGGRIVFRSFTKSQKIVNLARNQKLTVLVEDGLDYAELRGVMIQGAAQLIADRDYVLEIYRRLSAKYAMVAGERRELDAETLEATWGRYAEKNTAVVVEPAKIVTWDHTKLAGGY